MEYLANTINLPGFVSDTMALAAVALIGYLFGHRTRKPHVDHEDKHLSVELSRAARIAKELQLVTGRIRKEVAHHQSRISQFQTQIGSAQKSEEDEAWLTLTCEAEELLAPTMKLASNLSAAYDQLRQHASQLMNFAGSWSDLETGVGNRRALEEQLNVEMTAYEENRNRFSMALFSIEPLMSEHSHEHTSADLLRDFAELLEQSARDTDLVTRYGEDEFIVLMSQTSFAGAAVFSERLLHKATSSLDCVVAGGVVEVQSGDTQEKLLSRADSALYSARSSGRSCIFSHNGKVLRQLEGKTSEDVAEMPAECAIVGDGDETSLGDWKA